MLGFISPIDLSHHIYIPVFKSTACSNTLNSNVEVLRSAEIGFTIKTLSMT